MKTDIEIAQNPSCLLMFVNINISRDIIAIFKILYAFIVLDYKESENNLV